MSAPDTNLEKQERRHRGPLWGMWGGLAFVAILFVVWLGYVFSDADAPEGAATQTQTQVGGSTTTEGGADSNALIEGGAATEGATTPAEETATPPAEESTVPPGEARAPVATE